MVDFPITSVLKNISIVEETWDNQVRLNLAQLFFEETVIILRPVADTDEVELTQVPIAEAPDAGDTPAWADFFLGKRLQTVWVCRNSQNYQDQVIFAFEFLHPSIAFVVEGSVLKVFRFEQFYRPAFGSGSRAQDRSSHASGVADRSITETQIQETKQIYQGQREQEESDRFSLGFQEQEPDRIHYLKGEIYMMQRRPGSSHIVLNDRQRGLQVLEPWSGIEVFRTYFTAGYDRAGLINGWCFRADGQAVLVLSEKSRRGSWLSLEAEGTTYDIEAPPLQEIKDLRYLWEKELFWITGGKSFAFFELQWPEDEQPVFVERGGIHARKARRRWVQALDQLTVLKSQVLRVEPDKARMIYYDAADSPKKIGVLSWGDRATWSIPAPAGEIITAASHKMTLFVMSEAEVQAINQQGQIKAIYSAPGGFHFCGLDLIPSQAHYPAALVLACRSARNPESSQILIYALDD